MTKMPRKISLFDITAQSLHWVLFFSTVMMMAGCSRPPSPFAELERTRPVSSARVRSVFTSVDGNTQPQQGAKMKVAANQKLLVYGTVEDGGWKFGGTASFYNSDSFAWKNVKADSIASPLTKDEMLLVCCNIHRMATHTKLAKPVFEGGLLRVAMDRCGADFEFHLTAPAIPGEYVLDLVVLRPPNGATEQPSGESVFWRAKLDVTASQ